MENRCETENRERSSKPCCGLFFFYNFSGDKNIISLSYDVTQANNKGSDNTVAALVVCEEQFSVCVLIYEYL